MCLSPTSPRSPISPSYPSPVSDDVFDINEFHPKSATDVLKQMGFCNLSKLTDTLQGSIYRATNSANERVVIKQTNRYLHSNSITKMVGGKTVRNVQENIQLEQSILKYLTENAYCPSSIVKFHKFFETMDHYYLVMEDGGNSLFDFIKKAHGLIKNGNIAIDHWQEVTRKILRQMIECLDFLHSKNVCHFDISLENFLINDVEVVVKTTRNKKQYSEQLTFVVDSIQIKLCDFGLAELFTKDKCKSCKYVGKECYASPEVIDNAKNFDAKSNDIWCIGICLFMMATGLAPFNTAHKSDPSFLYMLEYRKMDKVLSAWNVLNYVDVVLYDLIDSILQYEAYRIDIKEIKSHPYF